MTLKGTTSSGKELDVKSLDTTENPWEASRLDKVASDMFAKQMEHLIGLISKNQSADKHLQNAPKKDILPYLGSFRGPDHLLCLLTSLTILSRKVFWMHDFKDSLTLPHNVDGNHLQFLNVSRIISQRRRSLVSRSFL